jgi:uncharacterized protein
MQRITVTDETRGSIIGNRIQIADTSLSRMVGLLGRQSLGAGDGLWIRPSSGIHTGFMRFPIDVIGLDKNMRVIKLWNGLVPWRVTSVSLQLRSVIELSTGRIAECGVQLGDVIRISNAGSA